jgi:hypothetical protein
VSRHTCECMVAPGAWALHKLVIRYYPSEMRYRFCGRPAFEKVNTASNGRIWVCDICLSFITGGDHPPCLS